MPTFRNRNSGQVVQVDDDPSHLSGLARWERTEEGPSAPATPPPAEVTAPVTVPEPTPAETESTQVVEVPADVPADESDALALPDADADRAEWVAYAKAQGKTDAELKGKKVDTIRGWFVQD